MLAEYFAPLPTSIDCTVAVWTGRGVVSAVVCCLHAVAAASRVVAATASESLRAVGFIGFTPLPGIFRRLPWHSRRKAGSVRSRARHWPRWLAAGARRALTQPIV